MHRSLAFALLLLTLTSVSAAQASWTQLMPGASPTGRTNANGAADLSGLLVFGGNLGGGMLTNDLWRFDGSVWSQLNPAMSLPPSARINHAATFDIARQRLVVFGGWDGTNFLGDTWEWDGINWFQLAPAISPSPRRFADMVYDLARGRTVLFGGWDGTQSYNETWEWDGATWTLRNPANSPPARSRQAMAYHRGTGETWICGGQTAGGPGSGFTDTWKWNGNDWSQFTTATLPGGSRLIQSVMAYDFVRDRLVLHGGYNGAYLSTTWEFDSSDWVDRGNTPGNEHAGHTMDFVLGLGKTLSFGGFFSSATVPATFKQETWEYQTNALASYATAGTGCAGSSGVPALSALSLPWIDSTLTVDVSNLASTAAPFMLIGLSTTSWSGGSLPFPLTAFGAPQCNLLVRPDATTFLPNQGGAASWSFGVPDNPALIGQPFFNQCIALELGGGGLSIAASGRGDAVIGAR